MQSRQVAEDQSLKSQDKEIKLKDHAPKHMRSKS